MSDTTRARLTQGNINRKLFDMTWPMVFGLMGITMFNLVDTYFIGQLGVLQLAAIGFTFPVITLINSLAVGIGIGASAVLSRVIGRGDEHRAARITTDSLILAVLLGLFLTTVGILTIEPVFRLIGADDQVMPYIRQYMQIWYIGTIFVTVPMTGNNCIRATGDTRTPALVMMFSGALNGVLDYLLIFGIGVFPELGMAGAALATVIGRMVTLVFALLILGRREKLLTMESCTWSERRAIWGDVMTVGVPSALTRVVQPLAFSVLTAFLASFGNRVVAGYGVASRIEMFSLIFLNSMATILAPLGGQNYGASEFGRIRRLFATSVRVSILQGLVLFAVFMAFGQSIAGLFTDEKDVMMETVRYLRIVSLGYIFYGIMQFGASLLNVMDRPRTAAMLLLFQMFGLCLPLAYIGKILLGPSGIYLSLALSWVGSAMLSQLLFRRHLRILEESQSESS